MDVCNVYVRGNDDTLWQRAYYDGHGGGHTPTAGGPLQPGEHLQETAQMKLIDHLKPTPRARVLDRLRASSVDALQPLLAALQAVEAAL
ncbi:MAG TPA: hypothetical protein VIT65_18255 [Microlunatus sp.]